jgi:hypothetical protein
MYIASFFTFCIFANTISIPNLTFNVPHSVERIGQQFQKIYSTNFSDSEDFLNGKVNFLNQGVSNHNYLMFNEYKTFDIEDTSKENELMQEICKV